MRRLAPTLLAALLWLGAPLSAGGADVPVAGARLRLRASVRGPAHRRATAVLEDAAIAAPLPDPTAGARLIVSGGAAPGQCFADVMLDPAGWEPIRGDGPSRGWRYRAPAGGPADVRRVEIRPGRIAVRVRGAGWPCALSAAEERLPLRVELRLGATRYCAAFAGAPRANHAGRFAAGPSAAPAGCPRTDVTAANLNLLHGLFCGGDHCRQAERIDLFYQWVAAEGCPDVVTVQEVWDPMVPLLEAQLATVCPFAYERAYLRTNGVDDAMLLSRYPVATAEVTKLFKNFRHVLHARIDHPLGPLDVFTTHLASSSDGAGNPCGADCPAECVAAGASTVRECQAAQLALGVEATHDVSTPALVTGDFNSRPGDFEVAQMTSRGWVDSYIAAGNPECDPVTSVGCTSGRASDLAELESPLPNVDERIDYVFVVPPAAGACALDGPSDDDGDGVATKILADLPNPFAPSCGPAPEPICWPSDHEGNLADLDCS